MQITFGSLQVKLLNSYSRGGVIYYQRAVPTDLRARYPSAVIKLNLETSNVVQASKRIDELNRRYEAEWAALRADPKSSPLALKLHAEAILRDFGLKPAPAENDQTAVELFHAHLDAKREVHADGDEAAYRRNRASEYLSPSEIKAAQLLAGRTQETLSDALELYLSVHPKRGDEKFVTYTRRAFGTLLPVIGDKAIADIAREDAHRYVTAECARNASTGTIRRRLNVISSVVGMYLKEKDLHRSNPFKSAPIPDEGKDAKKRSVLSSPSLDALLSACIGRDDQLRWLIALLIDTGARLAEVTGLALSDINVEDETPYIHIRPHPWRSLKNDNSVRMVPLVGASLWAAKRIVGSATSGQRFAFPQYTDERECRATSASNAISLWVRAQGLEHTAHELRHTIADRLREVQCPEDVRFAIGGWASPGVGSKYGTGYGLKVKHEWLCKIALKVGG